MRLTHALSETPRVRVMLIVADLSTAVLDRTAVTIAAIARVAEVHLVTRSEHRLAVSTLVKRLSSPVSVTYISRKCSTTARISKKLPARVRNIARKIVAPFSYAQFEEKLWVCMGDRLKYGEFDVVHRLTPCSSAIVSPLAPRLAKLGVPFVVGPLAVSTLWADAMEGAPVMNHPLLAHLQRFAQFMPGYRSMFATAGSILADSRAVMRRLPRTARRRSRLMPTPWVDSNEIVGRRMKPSNGPLRLLFAGNLTIENGIDLVLEAVAPLINAGKVTLDVVGNGQLAGWLHDTVIRDGLDGVRLHADEVSRQQMTGWYDRSDLLVAVGPRVTNPSPVLNAMASGLPAAVLGHGPLNEVVTSESGFVVSTGARADVIVDLRDLLARLATEREHISSRSAKAQWRAHAIFGADAAVATLTDVYHAISTQTIEKQRLAA